MQKFRNKSRAVVGAKYGRLTILEILGYRQCGGVNRTFVMCSCDCGDIRDYPISMLKSGGTSSCGCLRREMGVARGVNVFTKHGKSGHPLMRIWDGMIQRCYNCKNSAYRNYGGRGVSVCSEWRNSFESFYNWAISNGWELGLQLDKDILGNGMFYSPETCKFVTRRENLRAKRTNQNITFNGETHCVTDWATKVGVHFCTMKTRIERWGIERALTTPNLSR